MRHIARTRAYQRSWKPSPSIRDWRMALLGGSCTTLGAACLLLAACSTAPHKPLVVVPAPDLAIAPVAVEPKRVDTQTQASVEDASPWTRLSRRFTFDDCGYSPDVARLARWFSNDPTGFAESLRQSLPFLMYVAKNLEERDMPGEFALLPYIESNYVPIVSSGDHAAGIWQLLPDTAREAGLHIGNRYDGRLDVVASTNAALNLLERYFDRFGDWRVADMAFNAGPYRIAKLLGDGAVPASAAELGRLRVDAHTHRHLAKLLAVACIVSDPSRFDVTLPEPAAGDRLTAISLPAAVDLQLAARVAGLDPARLRQLNPGYVRGRMPTAGPYHLLLPEAQSRTLASALDKMPQSLWGEWHEITLRQAESLDVLAQAHDVDATVLATANALVPETALDAGMRVLVPGRGPSAPTAVATSRQVRHDSDTHVVRAGDSLWRIARAAHAALPDLLQWNNLTGNANLRPGQRLRLRAPERDGTASTAAASPN